MSKKASEFDLIEGIKERFSRLVPSDIEGIGDDCAVIYGAGDSCTVITADMLIEGTHFLRSIDPFDLGVRSVEVNISDVAAMGATPTALLLSVALPDWVGGEWCERFFAGIESCGVALVGGDTTRSNSQLCINITALGAVGKENIKHRSSAKVGDSIVVSGVLGESAASGYQKPVKAQVEQGVWLGARVEVGAMMDLSDGLAGDILHILSNSGVGAEIEIDAVPVHSSATIDQALSGGEDYKLLLTVAEGEFGRLAAHYEAKFGEQLYEIGRICEGNSLLWLEGGVEKPLNLSGYQHF